VLRPLTAGLASLWLLVQLFPLPGLGKIPSPHRASGGEWPHRQIIETIRQQTPELRATVGVLPSTPKINQQNVSFYGATADLPGTGPVATTQDRKSLVYGRQVGTDLAQVEADFRSLSWLITQADQLTAPEVSEPHRALMRKIIASPEFERWSWTMPNGQQLTLHHRQPPAITVLPGPVIATPEPTVPVKLVTLELPTQAVPGQPIPVTYTWQGTMANLSQGMVLLDWQPSQLNAPLSARAGWQHDHALGMGQLLETELLPPQGAVILIERLAMLPPQKTGTYRLTGRYLNRVTGQTYPLPLPPTPLTLLAQAPLPSIPVSKEDPALDWVSQFQQILPSFQQGNLDPVFQRINQLNRYDPAFSYLDQTIAIAQIRLQQDPHDLKQLYGLALAQALQQQPATLKTLTTLTQVDKQNPFAWAYLGFVNLYFWHPQAAQTALVQAARLAPDRKEIRTLQGVAALMQFNLPQAWALLH
jgi:hypothetical protein